MNFHPRLIYSKKKGKHHMSTPTATTTSEFTEFTPEQKALIKQLDDHWTNFSQSNAPAASRYLSEDHIPDMHHADIDALIIWGLVTTGETDYIGKDNGYALTEAGIEIAHHLALEKAVPDYAYAGWQAALVDEMNKTIQSVQARRAKDAKALAERQQLLADFKMILEKIGVKNANPIDDVYIHQGEVWFYLRGVRRKKDSRNEPVLNKISFALEVQPCLTPGQVELLKEMRQCNMGYYNGKYCHFDFKKQYGEFSNILKKYPVSTIIKPDADYDYFDTNNDLWPVPARQFAEFTLVMDANWQQLQIEYEQYGRAYEAWKSEQDRLEAERVAAEKAQRDAEAAAEQETDVYTEYDSIPQANPNAAWKEAADWLQGLSNRIEKGFMLDETDLWILGTVQIAQRLDRQRYSYEE
jgi:hypothetical protein